MSLIAKQLFEKISCELRKHIGAEFILSTKTKKDESDNLELNPVTIKNLEKELELEFKIDKKKSKLKKN